MFEVKETTSKGRCKVCNKGAKETKLYKITKINGEKKESHYLCKDCCRKTTQTVIEIINKKQDEEIRMWLKDTIYDPTSSNYNAVKIIKPQQQA